MRQWACVAFVCLIVGILEAHDPGFSTANVTLERDRVDAIVTFSQEEIADYLKRDGERDGLLLVNGEKAVTQRVEYDDDDNAIFHLSFSSNEGRAVRIDAPVVDDLIFGHRQHLLVRDENRDFVTQQLLKAGAHSTTVRKDSDGREGVGRQASDRSVFPFWTVWLTLMSMVMAVYILYRTRNAARGSALGNIA